MKTRTFLLLAFSLGELLHIPVVDAQSLSLYVGRWEGTLSPRPRGPRELSRRGTPRNIPMVVIMDSASDGSLIGTWATSRKGIAPISEIAANGTSIRILVPLWNAIFEGTVSTDGSTLEGGWLEGKVWSPLNLTKVAAE